MASIPYVREIILHPNSGETFMCFGTTRRLFSTVPGSSANNQIAAHINEGATDRRPGTPGQLLGTAAIHFLEGLEKV